MGYYTYPHYYGYHPYFQNHYYRTFPYQQQYQHLRFYPSKHQGKRQLDPEFQKVWAVMQKELEPVYEKLMEFNMNRATARFFVQQFVIFAIQNAGKVTGSNTQKVNQLWNMFLQNNVWLMGLLTAYRIPRQEVERIVKRVFTLTLENINFSPDKDWNGWESLGGRLTSGPGSSSWAANRLDIFARGENRNLIH
jgi:hypothetical protein